MLTTTDLDPGRAPRVERLPGSNTPGDVVTRLVDLHRWLQAQPALAPSPAVDPLFTELVQLCTGPAGRHSATVLQDERTRSVTADLRQFCATGETLLERTWAERIGAAVHPAAELAGFPYLRNYDLLTRLEVHSLAATGQPLDALRRIGFIGGGPLPLSAIALRGATAAAVHVVDRDPVANALARALLERLGADDRIAVTAADAETGGGLAAALDGCQVVVLAALVGLDPVAKRAVLHQVSAAVPPGTRVLVRSADGLRGLLYPVVDPADVDDAGLTAELVVHPQNAVVNSVLVTRRR